MLPSGRALAARHAAFCSTYGVAWRDCAGAFERALRLAAALAGDRAEDEPAALLLALTLHPRDLGDAWSDFPIAEARRLARSQGLHLDVKITDVELENLRLRLVQRRAQHLSRSAAGQGEPEGEVAHLGFEELRAFLAARTRPLHLRPVR
jgi:hypothetical protein